ncbi:hypothetical protein BX661DRAFT_227821 [Kickxella alabastrina]|uniref:uncharacterized protein n=1 Tax=Kickxella alabastrina TaxID=61397 RepID=UPI00221E7491|nr:uncharacterized protein BX661DRAFT_227821 [Kickxella alabastrina]KAI7818192.1 hypothetical protein BX661DRAFT_227821 [Kickxella alabastrina]
MKAADLPDALAPAPAPAPIAKLVLLWVLVLVLVPVHPLYHRTRQNHQLSLPAIVTTVAISETKTAAMVCVHFLYEKQGYTNFNTTFHSCALP